MSAKQTMQAVRTLEEHLAGGHAQDATTDDNQPCYLAITLALISIAHSLDTLCDEAADIAEWTNRISHH